MSLKNIFLSLVLILVNLFGIPSAQAVETPITGTDVQIIYGFSGRNGAAAYAAIGWQVWNPGNRYGFAWKTDTGAISDADLIALPKGGGNRTQDDTADGSSGFDRWEWNNAPLNFDTGYLFKVGIFNEAGALVDTAEISIPAITDPGAPSDGLSNMPLFYPSAGVHPYALGGLFNEIPEEPVILDKDVNVGIVEIDLRFPVPESISEIQYSTDDGTTWDSGNFTATAFGSIVGTLKISTESDGTVLNSGSNYSLKVRAKNGALNGSAKTLSCFVYSSSGLSSCSTPSGGGGGGGSAPSSNSATVGISVPPVIFTNPLRIRDTYFKSLTADQIATITSSQFRKLPQKTLALISAAQARALTTAQLKVLKPAQVLYLKPTAIAALSSSQISALEPNDFKVMKRTQIAKISADGAKGLNKKDLNAFKSTQLRSLKNVAVSNLNPTVINSLTLTKLKQFSQKQLKAFTAEQKAVLTSSERKSLGIK